MTEEKTDEQNPDSDNLRGDNQKEMRMRVEVGRCGWG